jgi:toxin ParE1/3/4
VRIRYRPRAVAQLDEIFAYIAADNPSAAAKVVSTIKLAIERLADFPYSAPVGKVAGIRELTIVR